MNKDEIIAFLKAHKEEMRQRYGVKKIGLFGSYVRGEAKEDSDVDIAVEMDELHIFRAIPEKSFAKECRYRDRIIYQTHS